MQRLKEAIRWVVVRVPLREERRQLRWLWPQPRSPLIWDVFAVSTYATVSFLFWFTGLIPDFATMRDKSQNRVVEIYRMIVDKHDDYAKLDVRFKEVTVNWYTQHPEIDAGKSELIRILTTKE